MELKKIQLNSKRILSILLLFLFIQGFSQRVSVENKHIFPLQIRYKNNIIKLKEGEKRILSDKEIDFVNIEYDNGKKIISRNIPILLDSSESLDIIILNNSDQTVEFKGDKVGLHDLIVNKQHYILYKNIGAYQDILSKNTNVRTFINLSELVLSEYLIKIKKLNDNTLEPENKIYKRIEKYVINDWVASVYLVLTGASKLDNQSKEIILYYYNKYVKKDIDSHHCYYDDQYYIINELARYKNQLGIVLPTYEVKVKSSDDVINQYIPQSCQRFYFINKYNYYNHLNSSEREFYKNILKEKFNN